MERGGDVRRVAIRVYGRVQGVGFRFAAHRKGEKYGVACEPRNEPDGSVFIEAEGAPAAVEKFIAWCRRGSWGAHVERVDIEECL